MQFSDLQDAVDMIMYSARCTNTAEAYKNAGHRLYGIWSLLIVSRQFMEHTHKLYDFVGDMFRCGRDEEFRRSYEIVQL